MRVRFLSFGYPVLTKAMRDFLYSPYNHLKEGQITILPDNIAEEYIKEKIVEPFSYSIPDDKINQLYKEFRDTTDFKEKVKILIIAYSKSVTTAILEDGAELEFKLTPENPHNWLYYNSQLIEYYKNESSNYDLKGLIKVFEKKRENSPDQIKLIDSELHRIKMCIEQDKPSGLSFWYSATNDGVIPRDEDGYKSFISNNINFGIETFLQGKAFAEYETFLKTEAKMPTKNKDKKVISKSFPEYLQTDIQIILAKKLKAEFSIDIGMNIRRMIELLRDKGGKNGQVDHPIANLKDHLIAGYTDPLPRCKVTTLPRTILTTFLCHFFMSFYGYD